jgi:protein-tyrosine phosphatase
MLPGFAGGPRDVEAALTMARNAVADGVMVAACTPVNQPGFSMPTPAAVRAAVTTFERRLIEAKIPLHVVPGMQCHVRPGLAEALRSGELLPVNGSRYALVDLPQMVMPSHFQRNIRAVLEEGMTPILCNPERLKWLEAHFEAFRELGGDGAWFQISAGSLTGQFGARTRYWAERLLGSSMAHVLAGDGRCGLGETHALSQAFDVARSIVGEQAALDLVLTRPLNVLDDEPAAASPSLEVVVEETWGPVLELRSLLRRAG